VSGAEWIQAYWPILSAVGGAVVGFLIWVGRELLKQIRDRDATILKQDARLDRVLETQHQSSVNGTLAIEKSAQASIEVRAVLERVVVGQDRILENQQAFVDALNRLSDILEVKAPVRRPPSRSSRT
jgi:hypothetical protein